MKFLAKLSRPPKLVGILDWELSDYRPFGVDAAQILTQSVINRNRVDCPDPKSASVAEAFWNSLTASIPWSFKPKVVDAMKIGMILVVQFPERLGVRQDIDIQNAETRLQWIEDTFRPLCAPKDAVA